MSANLKNIAIVAHVDHGKTTLVDGLLKQSETLGDRDHIEERVMDSGDIEKERGITITAKNCALKWKDYKINLLDTPGHADFGGEVERSLNMVDGVILLVDAAEGPLPQTRFVLQKAMESRLKIAVVINKVDRSDERTEEVKGEAEDLLLELATMTENDEFDFDIPILYASAKEGWASTIMGEQTDNLHCILDLMISEYFPKPKVQDEGGLQILVTNLAYSTYLGQQIVGKISRGSLKKNEQYTLIGKEKSKHFKATSIQVYDGLNISECEEAQAGEIIILSGADNAEIGDTVSSKEVQEALTRITVEPPTVSVFVSVSTSPLSGREGEYLTSRKLEEYLIEACHHNVALKYEATEDPKVYKLMGRGELQLAIVFEEIRRQGYELMVGRPMVLFKEEDGQKTEPYEHVVIDTPSESVGTITEKLSQRKGIMKHLQPIGDDRSRVEFEIPSRGMIGYRSIFLTDTRGEGIMSSQFLEYRPYAGDMLARQNGAIIADRDGKATPYALFNLLDRGKQFIKPGEQVYSGMVVGENTKTNDINVNVVREKHLSSVRTAGKDQNIILPPIPNRNLEWAMDWIDNDEWVEVTPVSIRIRKKELDSTKRSVVRR